MSCASLYLMYMVMLFTIYDVGRWHQLNQYSFVTWFIWLFSFPLRLWYITSIYNVQGYNIALDQVVAAGVSPISYVQWILSGDGRRHETWIYPGYGRRHLVPVIRSQSLHGRDHGALCFLFLFFRNQRKEDKYFVVINSVSILANFFFIHKCKFSNK